MPFDPNEYVTAPVAPEDETKKQETTVPHADQSAEFDPDKYLASPVPQETSQENTSLTPGGAAAGAGQVALDIAKQYGPTALEIGGGVLAAKKAFSAIDAYKAQTASNILDTQTRLFNNLITNYQKMNHDIRQYQQKGMPVPQELRDAQARLGHQIEYAQKQIPGYNPEITAKPTAPVVPETPVAGPKPVVPTVPTAPVAQAGEVGAQAVDHAGIMKRIGELYKTYGPAVSEHLTQAGRVIAESPVGKIAGAVAENPLVKGGARILAGPEMATLMALTHSRGLNEGEDEALAKMQTRLNQIGQGGNTPNALTSGFSQQLNTLNKKRTEQ